MWVHSGIMKTFNCNISTQFVENKSIFLRMENRRIYPYFFLSPKYLVRLSGLSICVIFLYDLFY